MCLRYWHRRHKQSQLVRRDRPICHVLAADAPNPGVPPNLDRPDGTTWKIDVDPTAAALSSYPVWCCANERNQAARRWYVAPTRDRRNIICMCCVISAHPSSAVYLPTQAMAISHQVEPPIHPGAQSVETIWIAKCRRAIASKCQAPPKVTVQFNALQTPFAQAMARRPIGHATLSTATSHSSLGADQAQKSKNRTVSYLSANRGGLTLL